MATNYALFVYGYVPTKTSALIGAGVCMALAVAIAFRLIRCKTWWAIALPIGLVDYAVALGMRCQIHNDPTNKIHFLFMEMLVYGTPSALISFMYPFYARLFNLHEGMDKVTSFGKLTPKHISFIFTASDGLTFTAQTVGAVLQMFEDKTNLGRKILIAAMAAHFVSSQAFVAVVWMSHRKLKGSNAFASESFPRVLLLLLYFSSSCVVGRALFRLIDRAQGGQYGYLWTHEVFFYLSDGLPLVIAFSPYVMVWPGTVIAKFKGWYGELPDAASSSLMLKDSRPGNRFNASPEYNSPEYTSPEYTHRPLA